MINLYSVRNQKKDPNKQQDSSSSTSTNINASSSSNNDPKASPAQLRAAKDFREISLPTFVTISQPNKSDVMNYKVVIKPDEGFYRNGKFAFDLKIPSSYPHEPPKLKCETKIFHPNIDHEEPNVEDPLDKEAAELLKRDKDKFEQNVKRVIMQNNHYYR